MTRRLERVVRAAARRPSRVLAVAVLLAVAGGLLALTLKPSAATDTLVGRSDASFKATQTLHERFGDDPVAVLVRGDLKNLVLTANLQKLVGLEGCLGGNTPADVTAPGGANGPCAKLAALKPVQVVYGPGTFINSAVNEIATQLQARSKASQTQAQQAGAAAAQKAKQAGASNADAEKAGQAAAQAVQSQFVGSLLQIATRYGLSTSAANPSITNPQFVYSLVFDATRGAYAPKARFAYLFPTNHAALISVRLKPDLSDDERSQAIGLVRKAVAMDRWKLTGGASYLVSGAPVVVNDVTESLSSSLIGLLVGGLLMMAFVLPLVFRRRYRMLPLAVALGAAGTVFGLMALLGARLTLASIAVLPVLLGLGVDYAIQYQARLEEEGVTRAMRLALPTIGTAVLATVAGFAVLLLSPVPMVRGFGLVLMGGVILSFGFALTAGTAALAALSRSASRPPGRVSASVRGAGDLLALVTRPLVRPAAAVGRAGGRLGRRVTGASLRRPVLVLSLGSVLAVGGWVVDSRTEVVSDLTQLVPRDLPAVRDVLTLQDETNIAGEVDVLVRAKDMTDPKVVTWMRAYQQRIKTAFKYTASNGCGEAAICPAVSLTDLFRTPESASSETRIRSLLDAVPAYFSSAVITSDRTAAVMSFGIKLLPLDRQQDALDLMRSELHPPAGVTAQLAGLPVLAAEANAKLTDPPRRLGSLLAGLIVVALALLAVYRRWARAWIPLVPIALATGWSALVLWLLGVPLNPMSATLGALVIAISTEFAVLLVARYREERDAGLPLAEALSRTYASTGVAVLASGVTAIAGFAVLAFSDVTMLRDFGRVTVVDLTVSLLGVLAVLPAVLALHDRRAERAERSAETRKAVPA